MNSHTAQFSPTDLEQALAAMPPVTRYVVGLSGGADSVSLLHALLMLRERLNAPVHALHVHHGLHPQADAWADFCVSFCAQWNVPLEIQRVQIERQAGESLEMSARRARYAVFDAALRSTEGLLLAHHQDDQVETVLLNLFKGAGQAGLAGIPPVRTHGGGFLIFRPLLGFSRASLQNYLRSLNLRWVEDDSNLDTTSDRNYLRHSVLPIIRDRWPGLDQCVSRAARLQRDTLAFTENCIKNALADAYDFKRGALKVSALKRLSSIQRRLVLRHWLAELGPAFNLTEIQLQQLERDFLQAKADRQPEFRQGKWQLRLYRGCLYKTLAEPPAPELRVIISGDHKLEINAIGLYIEPAVWLQLGEPCEDWLLCFRRSIASGGESLKKRFQSSAVPPWERDVIPLLENKSKLKGIWGEFLRKEDA
ncbi:MAG: tRNA lysidine(34) synthetase TilS [Thiotrichales bacterium]